MSEKQTDSKVTTSGRWAKYAAVVAVGVALLIFCLPYLVAVAPLRNLVVGGALAGANVRATAEGASFGWFSPLMLRGLRLRSSDDQPLMEIDRFEAESPWWKLLVSPSDLGRFSIQRPRVDVILGKDGSNFDGVGQPVGKEKDRGDTILAVTIEDGLVIVGAKGSAKPSVRLEGINLVTRVERTGKGRVLSIDPIEPLDHVRLTEAMCRNGLHLVAPVLANATRVQGTLSLAIDHFHVPVGRPEQARISGRIALHAVEAGIKSQWARDLMQLVSVAAHTRVPSMIRIADQSVIHFQVENGRVHHDGLAFGLPGLAPDLVVRTRGSVGLDETLDLVVQVPNPLRLVKGSAGLLGTDGKTMELRVGGTFDHPKLSPLQAGSSLQALLTGLLDKPTDGKGSQAAPIRVQDVLNGIGKALDQIGPASGRQQSWSFPGFERLGHRRRGERHVVPHAPRDTHKQPRPSDR